MILLSYYIIVKMVLKKSFNIYKNVLLIFIFITNYLCFANKIQFSRWIKTDSDYPKEIFIFETILSKGIDKCVESCKAKSMCKYINFKVNVDMCSLIGVANTSDETDIYDDKIEKKEGYILGRKQDWTLGVYEECKDCGHSGECKIGGKATDIKCQNSGCGPPKEKELASIHGNMFSIGNKAKYQCQEGYKNAHGNNGVVTCQSSGTWSTIDFKCVKDSYICHEGTCYMLDHTSRNWDDAKSFCYDIGGHLANIETKFEYLFVRENFQKTSSPSFWIGGHYLKNEGKWVWLDGKPVDDGYKEWGLGQPDIHFEYCMVTYEDLKWHDAHCHVLFRSLCEFDL